MSTISHAGSQASRWRENLMARPLGVRAAVAAGLTGFAVLLGVVGGALGSNPDLQLAASADGYATTTSDGFSGSRIELVAGGLRGGAAITYLKFDLNSRAGLPHAEARVGDADQAGRRTAADDGDQPGAGNLVARGQAQSTDGAAAGLGDRLGPPRAVRQVGPVRRLKSDQGARDVRVRGDRTRRRPGRLLRRRRREALAGQDRADAARVLAGRRAAVAGRRSRLASAAEPPAAAGPAEPAEHSGCP